MDYAILTLGSLINGLPVYRTITIWYKISEKSKI